MSSEPEVLSPATLDLRAAVRKTVTDYLHALPDDGHSPSAAAGACMHFAALVALADGWDRRAFLETVGKMWDNVQQQVMRGRG